MKQDSFVPTAQPGSYRATDALGRTLPAAEEVGPPRPGKFVGLFYWTWHGLFAGAQSAYNNQRLLDAHPELNPRDVNSPLWGPPFAYHFWNEPIYGYYSGMDEWVLRRHAELLADAGVDVIVFDNTNGSYTWIEAALCLLRVFEKARHDGVSTPQVAFMLPFFDPNHTRAQLLELYEKIYEPKVSPDLWFRWEGKPLILAPSIPALDERQAEILRFFTFRCCQPDYAAGQTQPRQWGWLCAYPQAVFRREDGSAEQMTVGIAQNRSYTENRLAPMNSPHIMGRSYTSRGVHTEPDAVLYGYNFAEQWERALAVDPDFVFVTGWNEWVAQRLPLWEGVQNAFADQYCDEYSRDIEPTKGRLKDLYYYQLCAYIRCFKGAAPQPPAGPPKTIDLQGGNDQWRDVSPRYAAPRGGADGRDADGYRSPETGKPLHYTAPAKRNVLQEAKVADDEFFLYFTVVAADALTPPDGGRWMRLLIATDAPGGWEGFRFILNRLAPNQDGALLERFENGWHFADAHRVAFALHGARFTVKIPKRLLGITTPAFSLAFKWADNNLENGDILDIYTTGSTMPNGRFAFSYRRN